MQIEQNVRNDPNFQSIHLNVSCNIFATTIPILDFNGAFEPPDPYLAFISGVGKKNQVIISEVVAQRGKFLMTVQGKWSER